MNVYTADDQAQSGPTFTLYNSYTIATAMQSGAQQAFLADELAPTVTSGTSAATATLNSITTVNKVAISAPVAGTQLANAANSNPFAMSRHYQSR
jgi:hypothetical protein